MMKKGRRVVMMESSPSSSSLPPLGGGGDARARFKHQVLLQDYGELLRETEAKKRKLQKTIEKKLKLMVEVKFLRRKYMSFSMKKPSQATPCRLKKLTRKKSSPSVRFAQPQNTISSSVLPLQDRNQRAKEAGAPITSALFDLNKVSLPNAEEMEGIHADWEALKVDKFQRCSVDGEVVVHDLNLSIFKDVGNGSGHVNKRKISWRDQHAQQMNLSNPWSPELQFNQ